LKVRAAREVVRVSMVEIGEGDKWVAESSVVTIVDG
jgi:hypothetical protein